MLKLESVDRKIRRLIRTNVGVKLALTKLRALLHKVKKRRKRRERDERFRRYEEAQARAREEEEGEEEEEEEVVVGVGMGMGGEVGGEEEAVGDGERGGDKADVEQGGGVEIAANML